MPARYTPKQLKDRVEEDGSVSLPSGKVRDAETGKVRKRLRFKSKPDAVTEALAKRKRG